MLEPLNRHERDSKLFQFTTKQMRDFIAPDHLLIRIDEKFDFATLVEPLEAYYSETGRPAIHPEVMVRALLISAIYNITSFRRLCSAISENIAYRWFCFMTIDDMVFDHSTITYFIERIGGDGFAGLFERFNQELLRAGLLSPRLYADASLVQANVGSHGLSPSGMTVTDFQARAVQENGLFVVRGQDDATTEVGDQESTRYFQDPKGHLQVSPVDPDARWRTYGGKRPDLSYQENVLVDEGGFVLARKVAHASEAEWKSLPGLLDKSPVQAESVCADTGYSNGVLRKDLEDRGVEAYIPIHPNHSLGLVTQGEFTYKGDHLVCPQGKILKRLAHREDALAHLYSARQLDCQACPIKGRCLPPRRKVRLVKVNAHHDVYLRAQKRNESAEYQVEMRRRRTTAEGIFASFDRLGWKRCKLRGLWKVDCEGYLASLAHNVLKAVRRLAGPVGSARPATA
jgi:transposase